MPDILVTSLSGLQAYQGALTTTSHNVANVGNEDYSRQRVELNARLPLQLGRNFFGQGVELTDVSRIVDEFNILNIRELTSNTGRLDTFSSAAARVETIIADEQASLMPALDGFFDALNDVANDPSADAPRVALLGAAELLQQRLNSMGTQLQDLETEIEDRARTEIEEINALTSDIARINASIISLSNSENQPNDLLDQRDGLLKRLSEKLAVTVVEQSDGIINVLVGTGQLLVTNATSLNLVPQQNPAQPDNLSIGIQASGGTVDVTDGLVGGELGGLLDFRNNLLSPAQNRLGRTAIALAQAMNDQHIQGYDLNNNLGQNMFSSVATGHLQGQFGGDYLNNGFAVGDTVSFDLQFDGRSVSVSHTVGALDTNQTIATALLTDPANGINADPNVTDNLDGTYTLAGTTPGVSMTFELYGSNIKFESAGGPSPLGNNLVLTNLVDTGLNDAVLELGALGSSSTRTTSAFVSNANPASFIGPSTLAINNANNTGTASMHFSITDVSVLTVSDYEARFDGVNYNIRRLSDNTVVATGLGPFVVDGMEITAGGAPNLGDSFYISPSKLGAVSFTSQLTDSAQIAAALPIRATGNVANLGSIEVTQTVISDSLDGDLTRSVDIFFDPANPAGTFDVIDNATGVVLQNDVLYFDGINVSQNGWQIQLRGIAEDGDRLNVQENVGGVFDNRNALSLANLQTLGVLDNSNSTFEQSYNALVSEVGVVKRQADVNLEVEESLLESAIARRESISGVNLDEEAANLIRFQQAYQAMSRVVQASQEIFQSLINAV